MTGIKDGISGGLTSQDNSDTGLSESNFISIDEVTNSGLNYHDVATEGLRQDRERVGYEFARCYTLRKEEEYVKS